MQTDLILNLNKLIVMFILCNLACQPLPISHSFYYKNSCQSIKIKRTYTKSNLFVDSTFEVIGNNLHLRNVELFKIENGHWYISVSNKWKPYLSKQDFNDKKTTVLYEFGTEQCSSFLKPLYITRINGKEVYVYSKSFVDLYTCTDYLFYFDFEIGLIKTEDRCETNGCQVIELMGH